jgi:hypothetical protein
MDMTNIEECDIKPEQRVYIHTIRKHENDEHERKDYQEKSTKMKIMKNGISRKDIICSSYI